MTESKENTNLTAFSVLQKYQRQLDPDGLDVGVNRQALEEVLKDYCKLEARLAKWESSKNPDHYGPHCAGLCEGAAYTVKIRELESRLAEKEVTVQRLRNTLSSVAGWYLPETLQRADTISIRQLARRALDESEQSQHNPPTAHTIRASED